MPRVGPFLWVPVGRSRSRRFDDFIDLMKCSKFVDIKKLKLLTLKSSKLLLKLLTRFVDLKFQTSRFLMRPSFTDLLTPRFNDDKIDDKKSYDKI